MYRKRFQLISPDRIVEFIVLDREFPRAIHYCIVSAEASLHAPHIASSAGQPSDSLVRNASMIFTQPAARSASPLRASTCAE